MINDEVRARRETEAQRNQESYLHLIDGLSREVNAWPTVDVIDRDHLGPMPRVNVSIKLSCLYSQFDPLDPAGTTAAVCARIGLSHAPARDAQGQVMGGRLLHIGREELCRRTRQCIRLDLDPDQALCSHAADVLRQAIKVFSSVPGPSPGRADPSNTVA